MDKYFAAFLVCLVGVLGILVASCVSTNEGAEPRPQELPYKGAYLLDRKFRVVDFEYDGRRYIVLHYHGFEEGSMVLLRSEDVAAPSRTNTTQQ